jgi:hypothetical protein
MKVFCVVLALFGASISCYAMEENNTEELKARVGAQNDHQSMLRFQAFSKVCCVGSVTGIGVAAVTLGLLAYRGPLGLISGVLKSRSCGIFWGGLSIGLTCAIGGFLLTKGARHFEQSRDDFIGQLAVDARKDIQSRLAIVNDTKGMQVQIENRLRCIETNSRLLEQAIIDQPDKEMARESHFITKGIKRIEKEITWIKLLANEGIREEQRKLLSNELKSVDNDKFKERFLREITV